MVHKAPNIYLVFEGKNVANPWGLRHEGHIHVTSTSGPGVMGNQADGGTARTRPSVSSCSNTGGL